MKICLMAVVFSSFVLACSSAGIDSGNRIDASDAGDAGGGNDDLTHPGPPAQIQANVSFLLKSVSPNEAFKPNTSYEFEFEIEIHSSQDEQFRLAPRIEAGWAAVVKDSDKIDASYTSAITGLKVTKVLTVTTGAVGTGHLVLDLDGTKFPTFNQSSQPTRIVLGATPAIPSSEILFVHVAAFGPAEFRDNTLFVPRQPPSNSYVLNAQALFQTAGTYQISAPIADPPVDWPVERASSASLNIGGAGGTGMIALRFTPKTSGGQVTAADGQVSFTVTSPDGLLSVPFSAQLRVVDAVPPAP